MQVFRPYKDKFVRFYIVFLGIFLLFLLNSIFFIYFFYTGYLIYRFVILLFIGYFYWQKYRIFSKLKYCIENDKFIICIGNDKFDFELSKIECIEKYNVSLLKKFLIGWGVKYDFFSKSVFFTTALSNLYLFRLKDKRQIVLSLNDELMSFFLYKYKIKNCNE